MDGFERKVSENDSSTQRARRRAATRSGLATVSVVIPALNEQGLIGESVRNALSARADEVVVVDGGSSDLTMEEAEKAGARVFQAEKGRARQMNVGAAKSRGEELLFLHADTTLPESALAYVRVLLGQPGVVAGAFGFGGDGSTDLLGSVVRAAGRLRLWALGVPYGDQGLFMRREIFESLGGFPDMPVLEDYEMALRLRRLGRVAIAPIEVRSSIRRWRTQGLVKPSLLYVSVMAGHRLGIGTDKLARLWRSVLRERATAR